MTSHNTAIFIFKVRKLRKKVENRCLIKKKKNKPRMRLYATSMCMTYPLALWRLCSNLARCWGWPAPWNVHCIGWPETSDSSINNLLWEKEKQKLKTGFKHVFFWLTFKSLIYAQHIGLCKWDLPSAAWQFSWQARNLLAEDASSWACSWPKLGHTADTSTRRYCPPQPGGCLRSGHGTSPCNARSRCKTWNSKFITFSHWNKEYNFKNIKIS